MIYLLNLIESNQMELDWICPSLHDFHISARSSGLESTITYYLPSCLPTSSWLHCRNYSAHSLSIHLLSLVQFYVVSCNLVQGQFLCGWTFLMQGRRNWLLLFIQYGGLKKGNFGRRINLLCSRSRWSPSSSNRLDASIATNYFVALHIV